VGIVTNQEGKYLVGQRVAKDRYFGKWEFPGGKIESGESIEQALKREFLEETDLQIRSSEPFMQLNHDYPDRHVALHVQLITDYRGRLQALEGQTLKWVEMDELFELDFLAGNRSILEKLKRL
jgi:mutator mutT protein